MRNRYLYTYIDDDKDSTSRPRRFSLSISHKNLISDILKNYVIEKDERILIIVYKISNPNYLEPIKSSIEKTKAIDKKIIKKESVVKNIKVKNQPTKDKAPGSAPFKVSFRSSTRKTRIINLDKDVIKTNSIKLEKVKKKGLKIKEKQFSEGKSKNNILETKV